MQDGRLLSPLLLLAVLVPPVTTIILCILIHENLTLDVTGFAPDDHMAAMGSVTVTQTGWIHEDEGSKETSDSSVLWLYYSGAIEHRGAGFTASADNPPLKDNWSDCYPGPGPKPNGRLRMLPAAPRPLAPFRAIEEDPAPFRALEETPAKKYFLRWCDACKITTGPLLIISMVFTLIMQIVPLGVQVALVNDVSRKAEERTGFILATALIVAGVGLVNVILLAILAFPSDCVEAGDTIMNDVFGVGGTPGSAPAVGSESVVQVVAKKEAGATMVLVCFYAQLALMGVEIVVVLERWMNNCGTPPARVDELGDVLQTQVQPRVVGEREKF